MNHFQLIRSGIDVGPVLNEIERHPELWNANRRRKEAPGTPHSQMSDIWVRYNDSKPFEESGDWSKFNDVHVPVWYPAWNALPSLKPIVFELMSAIGGEMIGGILITKIPPGCGIDPHTDAGWHVEYYDKFYLQLKNSPGCVFGASHGGVIEELEPSPGDIWLFDNRKLHWVRNASKEDRITCIVCIRSDMFQRTALEGF